MPPEDLLLSYYPEDYYAYLPRETSALWKQILLKIACLEIKTHDPTFSETGNFLDIGCGSGAYLRVMAKRGWKVWGVEPSRHGAQAGRSAGFEVFRGSLLEASYPESFFDYVRSNHSFEHMPNPVEALTEIQRILRPGGKLFIGVPNVDSLAFRLFGRYWWYLGAPIHTYSYSAKTITSLLERAGFHKEKVFYNSNYWSLLGSLQIFLNRNTGERSEEGLLIRSKVLTIIANLAEKCLDRIQSGDAIEVISVKPG